MLEEGPAPAAFLATTLYVFKPAVALVSLHVEPLGTQPAAHV
jgi:hypothetical protein